MQKRLVAVLLAFALVAPAVFANGQKESAGAQSSAPVTIQYGLWDANQVPQYQAVADKFQQANPNITIKIQQTGWANYWTNLQTGFVSGTVPDVFTDHLFYYPEFSANNQIMDIEPLVKRDNVNTDIYYPGLAQLWMHNGKRYGLPKDWDTVAVFYNKDMTKKAGITDAEMNKLNWNPDNGGTFQQMIAKLTLDSNGNNGTSPNFDKSKVSQYGFLADTQGGAGAQGQTQWSSFAVSTGWWYTNAPVWGTKFNFDDPNFIKTMQWYADLSLKDGFSPSFADVPTSGAESLFVSGKVATLTDGDWMTKWIAQNAKFPVGIALLPTGPVGLRTMFNGLADSIWTGTKHKEQAWSWVKYLASDASETLVGSYGVIFPAVPAGAKASVAVQQKSLGVDPAPFAQEAGMKGATFPFPITEHSSDVQAIMKTALQAVFTGQGTAAQEIPPANQKVNALFQ
ncbi:MAG TPA: sugar ABC transporter substrate-binding protein [Spirochaetia bacterium]|nr:sugar ABC transporter substrate-binding protein [Spirochaetia bacterium]